MANATPVGGPSLAGTNTARQVDNVMPSGGGFLGVGDREVRIADLKISVNGVVNMTKDELKARPFCPISR